MAVGLQLAELGSLSVWFEVGDCTPRNFRRLGSTPAEVGWGPLTSLSHTHIMAGGSTGERRSPSGADMGQVAARLQELSMVAAT